MNGWDGTARRCAQEPLDRPRELCCRWFLVCSALCFLSQAVVPAASSSAATVSAATATFPDSVVPETVAGTQVARKPTYPGPRPVGPAHVISKLLFFAYQRGASPSKGHRCPMSPSCSEYGRLAVEHFGILRGSIMAADRLHRCGHDLRFYPIVFEDHRSESWDPPDSTQ